MSTHIGKYVKWVIDGKTVTRPEYQKVRVDFGNTEIIDVDVLNSFFSSSTYDVRVKFPKLTQIRKQGMYRCFAESIMNRLRMPRLTTVDEYGMYECCLGCIGLNRVSLKNLTAVGENGMQRCFYQCNSVKSIYIPKLETVGDYGLSEAFSGTRAGGWLDLSSLTTVGKEGMRLAFAGTDIDLLNIQNLESIGDRGLEGAFWGSSLSGVISFDSLTTVGKDGLFKCFGGTNTNIKEIHFPELSIKGHEEINPVYLGCPKAKIYFKDTVVESYYDSNVEPHASTGYVYNAFDSEITVMVGKNEIRKIPSKQYAYFTKTTDMYISKDGVTLTKDDIILSTGFDLKTETYSSGFMVVYGVASTTESEQTINTFIKGTEIPFALDYSVNDNVYNVSKYGEVEIPYLVFDGDITTTGIQKSVLRFTPVNDEFYCNPKFKSTITLYTKVDYVLASFNVAERGYRITVRHNGEDTLYTANTYYIGNVKLHIGDFIFIRTPYEKRPTHIELGDWVYDVDVNKWKQENNIDPTIGVEIERLSKDTVEEKDNPILNIIVTGFIVENPVFGIDVTYKNRV